MLTNADLEKLAEWGKPVECNTRFGARLLRKAKAAPGPEFWTAWKAQKPEMVALGISPKRQPDGAWELLWWQEIPSEVVQQRKANLELSRATDAEVDVPSPLPFGIHPFRDTRDAKGNPVGCFSVSIAFRHSPLSGPGPGGERYYLLQESPLPFGIHPFRDGKYGAPCGRREFLSPLPFGIHPFRDPRTATLSSLTRAGLHCLSAFTPFGTKPFLIYII